MNQEFSKDIMDDAQIESEKALLKKYLDTANIIFLVINRDGNIESINAKGCEILGLKEKDILGKNWFENFIPLNVRMEVKQVFNKIINKGVENAEFHDNVIINANGNERFISWHNAVIKDRAGNVLNILSAGNDITGKKELGNKLIEQETEQRSILQYLQDAIMIYAIDTSVIYSNPAAEKLFGLSSEQMEGKVATDSDWRFLKQDGDTLPLDEYPMSIILNGKKSLENYIMRIKPCNGDSIRWVSVNGHLIIENNQKQKLVISFNDITKNKLYEEELIRNNIKNEAMFANITDVISVLDKNGVIKYGSSNLTKWFGWEPEDLIDKDITTVIHPDDLEYIRGELSDLLKQSELFKSVEFRFMCKDGSYKYVRLNGRNLLKNTNINGILVNYHDITERKNRERDRKLIENRLNQQQRLESIGTLAGGVAHEINNPINGIMNYGQLIKDMSDENSEIAEYANEIIHETERVSTIVQNLLQFSRDEKQVYSYARIEDIINNTVSLIKTIIKRDQIDLKVDIPSDLPKIKCRSQQIQQVIMNLLTNARDTLNEKYPEYNEDKITKLYCSQFNKENRRWIRVTVEDHGKGIPEAMYEKIFEPFYSSKSRNKGTGLGLSISYGIVKSHHGRLTFETKEGHYTKFYLDLPVDNGWKLEN